jgi:hypothetical protein
MAKKPVKVVAITPVDGHVLVIFDKERNQPQKLISVKHAEILHSKGIISYK